MTRDRCKCIHACILASSELMSRPCLSASTVFIVFCAVLFCSAGQPVAVVVVRIIPLVLARKEVPLVARETQGLELVELRV
jgi:hypothetical protein